MSLLSQRSVLYRCDAAVMPGCALRLLLHSVILGFCPRAEEGSSASLSCPLQLEASSSVVEQFKDCGKTRGYSLGVALTDFHL